MKPITLTFKAPESHSFISLGKPSIELNPGFTLALHYSFREQPLTLHADAKPGDEIKLALTDAHISLFVNGELCDEEWPCGEISLDRLESSLDFTITDSVEELALPLRKNLTAEELRRPGVNVGDCMPFSGSDGKYHLYWLYDRHHHRSKWGLGAHQWAHASTSDLVHWDEHPMAVAITEQYEGSICTGSTIEAPMISDCSEFAGASAVESVSTLGSESAGASGVESVSTLGSESAGASGVEFVRTLGSKSAGASGVESVRNLGSESAGASAVESVSTLGSESVGASGVESVRTLGSKSVRTYCWYAIRMSDGSPARLTCSISEDGDNYIKSGEFFTLPDGYHKSSARDPKVVRHNGKYHMLVTTSLTSNGHGCLAHLVSEHADMKDFTNLGPIIEWSDGSQPECPDYFELGGYYYLVWSIGGRARYAYSKNPFGEGGWTIPESNIIDCGSVPKAAVCPWNGELVFTGFVGEGGYAGHIVMKKAKALEDGRLEISEI